MSADKTSNKQVVFAFSARETRSLHRGGHFQRV